ncbi:TPA: head-tail connector protein [Yersinia enterocolitica]|uniref:head-tail connector protein n=1 Tax=Yersinia enterocolitica TaxID=630 RepID=UPI0029153088|nr:phage head-tail connector protein [Yersinia enterocolitica]
MTITVTDVVPIDELREHVEFDGTDRDKMITRYAQGALDYCIKWCDEPAWKKADDIPAPVINAMLLVFADQFEHRLSQTEVQLYTNVSAENLMWFYRNWSNKTGDEN